MEETGPFSTVQRWGMEGSAADAPSRNKPFSGGGPAKPSRRTAILHGRLTIVLLVSWLENTTTTS
jgi:hypothetical protein